MKVSVQIDNADKILLKRALNQNGAAQRFFTSEVRRNCDPYVPRLTGVMKNTAIEKTDCVIYPQIYSRRQYYENKGSGLRGKLWDKRMWADRGKGIVKAVARFAGGRSV